MLINHIVVVLDGTFKGLCTKGVSPYLPGCVRNLEPPRFCELENVTIITKMINASKAEAAQLTWG